MNVTFYFASGNRLKFKQTNAWLYDNIQKQIFYFQGLTFSIVQRELQSRRLQRQPASNLYLFKTKRDEGGKGMKDSDHKRTDFTHLETFTVSASTS